MTGEYEPKDSRNVTGTSGQGMGAPGGADQQTGGERWGGDGQQQQSESGQQQGGHRQSGDQQGESGGGNQAGQQQQFAEPGSESGGVGAGYQQGGSQQSGRSSQWADQIREHMQVVGADGSRIGSVDHLDGDRIKLTKADSGAGFSGGSHEGHHHYISCGLIAGVEGDTIRLSANGATAYGMEEER